MNYALYPTPTWTTSENWRLTQRDYPWKINAIIRDKYRCVDCHDGSSKLIVHHIDGTGTTDSENNRLSNLVTLCKKCHSKRHGLNGSTKNKNVIEMLEQYSDGNKNLINRAATIIGIEVGLSRERIRQIANSAGFITHNNSKNVFLYSKCIYCGNRFKKSADRKTCSLSCGKNYQFYKYWTITECIQCHLYFTVRRSALEFKGRYYCSKTCQGKYIGEHYGIGTKGNSCNHHGQPNYNLDNLEKDLTDVFTLREFAEKYKYASINGAYNAISALKLQNIVEPYRIRGMYRIKQKSVVDKSL